MFSDVSLNVESPNGNVNDTFCDKLSLNFDFNNISNKVKFQNYDNIFCSVNIFQNDEIKEKCGNANHKKGFIEEFGDRFKFLNLPVAIRGLEPTMSINL